MYVETTHLLKTYLDDESKIEILKNSISLIRNYSFIL